MFLYYFNLKYLLFLDVNVSKEYRINTIIYYINKDLNIANIIKNRKAIKFSQK